MNDAPRTRARPGNGIDDPFVDCVMDGFDADVAHGCGLGGRKDAKGCVHNHSPSEEQYMPALRQMPLSSGLAAAADRPGPRPRRSPLWLPQTGSARWRRACRASVPDNKQRLCQDSSMPPSASLARKNEMMQIGARVVARRRAIGLLVQRTHILRMAGVADIDLAATRVSQP